MENQFTNFTPYTKSTSKKARAFFYVILFILLIGGAILLGNYFLSSQSNTSQQEEDLTPTVIPTDTPTPTLPATPSAKLTPTPSIAKKATSTPTVTPKVTVTPSPSGTSAKVSLSVEVLNGSGEKGAAGKAASILTAAGYSITSAGNADTFDYPQTVIQIKKSKASLGAQLRKDLATTYTVSPTIQTLAESSSSDAIVIVGAK